MKMKTLLVFTSAVTLINFVCTKSVPEVTIQDGRLHGLILLNYNGDNFYAFKGIPFAKPPVGEKRFMAPLKNDPWNGILNATHFSQVCKQPNQVISAEIGSEDCLYLNVFTKTLNSTALKPVLMYIHGGKFTAGSGSLFGPDFLMTEDIVLVTTNYRLGIYGFINFVDGHYDQQELVPNNGFRDQIMAMQWVQSNIAHFGGNPGMVTLVGESAGAISIHAHILSPLSKGLFHRAILMSGTTLMAMVYTLNNTALTIAKHMGIDTSDHNLMVKQLKSASGEELIKAQIKMNWFKIELDTVLPSSLVIEKPGSNSFISDYPLRIIRSGKYNKVPILLGVTNKEGLLIYRDVTVRNDLKKHIPFYFENWEKAMQLVKNHYNIDENSDLNNITMFTDIWFGYNTFRTAREHSQDIDIYYYKFSGDAGLNYMKSNNQAIANYTGACHADELGYLFVADHLPTCTPNSTEERLMKLMVEIWTNFVKFGKPSQSWERFHLSKLNIANITNDGLKFENLYNENFDFWDDMYKAHSRGYF